nr:prephenate dehydrogenase/arogenate dehydrogenase family protein [Pyrococcus furiosus]
MEGLGGKVEFMSVEEHDRIVGFVIGVPYLLGIAYLKLSLENNLERFGGTSFRFLTIYGKAVLNDGPRFIEEVIRRSREEIAEFLKSIDSVNVHELSKKVSREEIERAYEKFYKILDP